MINSFTQAANSYLKTKIDGNIEGLTLLDKFPQASITMTDVKIYGSLDTHKEKLAELDNIHFTISIFDLIRKEYKINAIYLEEGFINLYVDKSGANNYTFIEHNPGEIKVKKVHFDFKDIYINNVQINYENLKTNQHHRVYANELNGNLLVKNDITDLEIKANCNVEYISVDNKKYISNKNMNIDGVVHVDSKKENVEIPSLSIDLSTSIFIMKGSVNYSDNKYDLEIGADKTNFNILISLLPNSVSKGLQNYEANGLASFKAVVIKSDAKVSSPQIDIEFGCDKVSLKEPNTKMKISDLSFLGSFTNGENRSATTSSLSLKDLKGAFDGNDFEGGLLYENFDKPFISTFLKGEFPVSFFMQFSDSNHLKNIKGTIDVDLKLKALQKDLEENNKEAIASSGELVMKNISFQNKDNFYHFNNLNGSFIFNKNDIAISDFTGKINKSDFEINGYLRGFFSYFFNHKGKLVVMADLNSKLIDFDNLLESNHNIENEAKEIENEYLKHIQFNLNGNVKKVKWGRFNFSDVSGEIRHNDLVFKSTIIKGLIGGGAFDIGGKFNTRNKNNLELTVNTNLNGIHIDSIFYFFNDFNEDFITHKNMKGKVYVNSTAKMCFDKFLYIKPETIVADIDVKAKNGELNNFGPMQNLSKFLGEEELKNIHFSELNNIIHIENEKIEIPEMRINSSVSNLTIRGTHTFDQKIYYKLKVPLKNLKASKKKEAESAFEETNDGPTVHLIIKGTTDDFEIKYDKSATKKIVKEKVKEEIREIRDVIKGTHQEEEEEQIELEEEEFFDFDE